MSRQFWSETLVWSTASGTIISNSSSEALVMPIMTIPANYLQDGRLLRLTVRGKLSNIITTPGTITLRVRMGGLTGTVIASTGALNLNTTAQTDIMFELKLDVQVRSNGSTGTVLAMGVANIARLATDVPGFMGSAGATTPATVTLDLTTAIDMAVTAQFSIANSGNTLTGMQLHLEGLN